MHDPSDLAVVIVRGSCVLSVKFVLRMLRTATYSFERVSSSSYTFSFDLSRLGPLNRVLPHSMAHKRFFLSCLVVCWHVPFTHNIHLTPDRCRV